MTEDRNAAGMTTLPAAITIQLRAWQYVLLTGGSVTTQSLDR
jgi:hypothetical protein